MRNSILVLQFVKQTWPEKLAILLTWRAPMNTESVHFDFAGNHVNLCATSSLSNRIFYFKTCSIICYVHYFKGNIFENSSILEKLCWLFKTHFLNSLNFTLVLHVVILLFIFDLINYFVLQVTVYFGYMLKWFIYSTTARALPYLKNVCFLKLEDTNFLYLENM